MKSVSSTLHEAFPVSCLQIRKWRGWKHPGLKTPTFLSWPRKFIQLLINASRPSNAKHLDNGLSQGTWCPSPRLGHLSDSDLWRTESRSGAFLRRRCIPFGVSHSLVFVFLFAHVSLLILPSFILSQLFCLWFFSPFKTFFLLQDLELWEGNIRSDSLRRTSIYIFDKYLPQIISVEYHYLSVSLVSNSLRLDLLV